MIVLTTQSWESKSDLVCKKHNRHIKAGLDNALLSIICISSLLSDMGMGMSKRHEDELGIADALAGFSFCLLKGCYSKFLLLCFGCYSIFIFKNQPIFHYYYINIMSVHECTSSYMNNIKDFMSANSLLQF